MIAMLLSPSTWVGAAVGAGLTLAWAVFVHGPNRYEDATIATTARLDAATNKAASELANEADRADFLFTQCRARDGVYDIVRSVCIEGKAD